MRESGPVPGDFERAGSVGFRRLVAYIGAANRSQARVAILIEPRADRET